MIKSKTLHSWCVIARDFLAESGQKIGHSHLQEIFSAGLGFRTYAAIPNQFFASIDQSAFAVLNLEAMRSRAKSLGCPQDQHDVFSAILWRMASNPASYMYEIHERLVGALPIEANLVGRHLCEWASQELRVKNVMPPEGAFLKSAYEEWQVALPFSWERMPLFGKSEDGLEKKWIVSGFIAFDGADRLVYKAHTKLHLFLPELSKNLIGEPIVRSIEGGREFDVDDMDHYSDGSYFCSEIDA